MTPNAEIAARIDALPMLDTTVSQLARLVNDPNASLASFEALIRPDPALTANLLRVASSALYRGKTAAATVPQAITRVGMRRVWEIAAAGAFGKVMPKFLPGYEIDSTGFWRHSLAVAALSEAIARKTRPSVALEAFPAGLLHDMGKLAIGLFLDAERAELVADLEVRGLAMIEAEREILGTDHAEVGEAVAARWGLPAVHQAAARWHHDPESAPDNAQRDLASVVHIADALAHSLGFGADIGGLHRKVDPRALARLTLDERKLEEVACATVGEILEMSRTIDGGAS